MVLDTSALLAILFNEPEADLFEQLLLDDAVRLMAAPSIVEAGIVAESRAGDIGRSELDRLLHVLEIDVAPFTQDHVSAARYAFRTYGKGRHSAGLNFGDCFAYALSKISGEPLLFKGDDFAKTDVTPVRV